MKTFKLALLISLVASFQALAQLQVSTTSVDESCFGSCDGAATAIAAGGTAPYLFQWSNGSTSSSLTQLCAGNYTVTVMDNLGDTAVASVTVLQPNELTATADAIAASCNGAFDGSATVYPSGGVPGYTYQWSNGDTTDAIYGLSAGIYQVYVADAAGCGTNATVIVTEGNMGASINQLTTNPCTGPIQLQVVGTGGSGNYTYQWSTGETSATIMVSDTSLVQVTVTDGQGCSAQAFSYLPTANGGVTSAFTGWLNRGFCRWVYPVIVNYGCQTYTGPVTVTLDANVNFTSGSISPTPDIVSGNTITWNNVTLAPLEQMMAEIQVCVPLSVSCGDILDVSVTADGNTQTYQAPVLCSYDPNDKQVSPVGIGPQGNIENTEKLTYTVRFQNTGTAPATFIHVLDSLDGDLDVFSLEVVAASHPMELSINENHVLDFFFDNINLPDSTSDPAGSNGFVIFTIDMVPGLLPGTEIENTAEIYFDFNPAIITNTTLNTIDNMVGVSVVNEEKGFGMYPNPTSSEVTLMLKEVNKFEFRLFDSTGRMIQKMMINGSTTTLDVSALNSGAYILLVTSEDGHYQRKLMKQ